MNMQHEARGTNVLNLQSNDVSKLIKYWPRSAIRLTSGDISKARIGQGPQASILSHLEMFQQEMGAHKTLDGAPVTATEA